MIRQFPGISNYFDNCEHMDDATSIMGAIFTWTYQAHFLIESRMPSYKRPGPSFYEPISVEVWRHREA